MPLGIIFNSRAKNYFPLRLFQHVFIMSVTLVFLSACASSEVARDVSAGIDMGKQNANNLTASTSDTPLADAYANTSQAAKGAVLGGVAGALTGAVSSIGILPGTAIGAILGASYGSYIETESTLEDRLENRGVITVVLGDQILIVLPSTRIFYSNTADIKPEAYGTLDMVKKFINRFAKTMVKVAAYTTETGNTDADIALSRDQAQHIAKFFVTDGLDARLLYAVGYGASHLVEKNSLDWDASLNYRVEITFEKLYV